MSLISKHILVKMYRLVTSLEDEGIRALRLVCVSGVPLRTSPSCSGGSTLTRLPCTPLPSRPASCGTLRKHKSSHLVLELTHFKLLLCYVVITLVVTQRDVSVSTKFHCNESGSKSATSFSFPTTTQLVGTKRMSWIQIQDRVNTNLNQNVGLSQHLLTVDHPSRVGVPVCSVSDAPAAQLICFLYCHVLTVTTVHHTIGITVTTAGGEHPSWQASPIRST